MCRVSIWLTVFTQLTNSGNRQFHFIEAKTAKGLTLEGVIKLSQFLRGRQLLGAKIASSKTWRREFCHQLKKIF
jgi:hypothetical protein